MKLVYLRSLELEAISYISRGVFGNFQKSIVAATFLEYYNQRTLASYEVMNEIEWNLAVFSVYFQ